MVRVCTIRICTIRGRACVMRISRSSRYYAGFEISRSGRCRYGRLAVIDGGAQAAIAGGGLLVPGLRGRWREVPCAGKPLLFGGRSRVGSTIAAVVADAIHARIVDDRLVVRVMNDGGVYVHDRGVVKEVAASPVSALKASAHVSESIKNATVEADLVSPIASVPDVNAVAPSPISRSPQETDFGRENPRAGHPVVVAIVIVPSPIAGSPEVAISGANGLLIHGYCWRSKTDRNINGDLRGGGGRNGRDRR